jgi:hypothetical protein
MSWHRRIVSSGLIGVCLGASLTGVVGAAPAPAAASARPSLITMARAALARTPGVRPQDTINCFSHVVIYSIANDLFVSTELGYTGANHAMLRARASVVGPWEQYSVCRDEQTQVTNIVSDANGLYVSAELEYTGGNYAMLRARATTQGPWETWLTASDPPGETWILNIVNNRYVSAELGYTGGNYAMLRARGVANGPWELYGWS